MSFKYYFDQEDSSIKVGICRDCFPLALTGLGSKGVFCLRTGSFVVFETYV